MKTQEIGITYIDQDLKDKTRQCVRTEGFILIKAECTVPETVPDKAVRENYRCIMEKHIYGEAREAAMHLINYALKASKSGVEYATVKALAVNLIDKLEVKDE